MSPTSDLPYDVLLEIFTHCLPDSPLDELQPNTKIAPMLLCHVCTSWRTIALENPRLWLYFYHRLPVHWKYKQLFTWNPPVFQRKMECLKWWRANQGLKAPFIRFTLYPNTTTLEFQELLLTPVTMQFFADYLSVAQYLDVDRFVRYSVRQDILYSGSYALSCPNLHSLVIEHPHAVEDNIPLITSCLVPFHLATTLRRLHLLRRRLDLQADFIARLSNWSMLTHLSLRDIFMDSKTWYSLIRAVPNLQWGYFESSIDSADEEDEPPKFALHFLSTLSVALAGLETNLLRKFLQNLHLPILHNLSVYIDIKQRNLPGVAMDINSALKSAPAVTDLTFGFSFQNGPAVHSPETNWEGIDKLATIIPCLTHLVLDMCFAPFEDLGPPEDSEYFENNNTLSAKLVYYKEFLLPMRWLDLASLASTHRRITTVVMDPALDSLLVNRVIRGALELDKEEHGDKVDNIVFEIVARDTRGLAPYAEGCKTWGCSL